MPHDATGQKLQVGDTVQLIATVESISAGESACNVTLVVDQGQGDVIIGSITCNAKSVHKLRGQPEMVEDAAKRGFDTLTLNE